MIRTDAERHAADQVERVRCMENALAALSSGQEDVDAAKRLRELDVHWEADASLIPDHEAAEELLRRCKVILLAPRRAHEAQGMTEFNELIALGDRVLNSSRQRRRELA